MVLIFVGFFSHETGTPGSHTYCHTLSLHDALPIGVEQLRHGERAADVGQHDREGVAELASACRSQVHRGSPVAVFVVVFLFGSTRWLRSVQRWSNNCRSEEHTSELQSLMRISYAVFCLKKKKSKIIPANYLL